MAASSKANWLELEVAKIGSLYIFANHADYSYNYISLKSQRI
jgi:hypothetical protein